MRVMANKTLSFSNLFQTIKTKPALFKKKKINKSNFKYNFTFCTYKKNNKQITGMKRLTIYV